MTHQDREAFSNPQLDAETLGLLRNLDTCTLPMRSRPRRSGCATKATWMPPSAACFRNCLRLWAMRCPCVCEPADPPIEGLAYVDRDDWWEQFLAIPPPRVLVVEDVPGGAASGSILGDVHANIYRALGCAGIVTNGAVRDLPALRRLGFPVFASHVSVSHAYAHVVEVGAPVTVGGLQVHTGDLLHGDRHGVLSIPLKVAPELPAIAARAEDRGAEAIIAFCRSTRVQRRRAAAAACRSQIRTSNRPFPKASTTAMSRFAIRFPYFIIVVLPDDRGGRRDQPGADAGGSVSDHQHPGGGGGHLLLRDAARADRDRHHRPLRALLHAGQRHRPHRVALAAGREPDQGLLPARAATPTRRSRRSPIWRWPICAGCRPGRCRRSC